LVSQWYPHMQGRIRDRRADRAGQRAAVIVGAWLIAGALLAGCASTADNPLTLFVDPGKYQYYSCEQIAAQRKNWSNRQSDLKLLMDKADQSAGGAVVNVLAYKADYVTAGEELKVLESTARTKNCTTPANWKSNSTIR
jgi:hypothetical protein